MIFFPFSCPLGLEDGISFVFTLYLFLNLFIVVHPFIAKTQ